MTTIEPKDLNKGDIVTLKNGWRAEVISKAKGIRICLKVYGYETEIGDVYTRDLSYRVTDGTRDAEPIVLSAKHKKQFEAITAAGF